MTALGHPVSAKKVVVLHAIISPYKIELFNHLARLIPAFHVVYFSTNESRRSWVIDPAQIHHSYDLVSPGFIESMPRIRFAFRLIRLLIGYKPWQLILAEYSHFGYWIGLLIGLGLGATRVMINESTWQDRPRGWIKEWVKRIFVSRLHGAIAQSSAAKAYLEHLGMPGQRICVKGYSTHHDFYATGAKLARADREAWVQTYHAFKHNILFVGRFSEEKNLLTLLAAWQTIQDQHPDWGVILLGDGPQERLLRDTIASQHLRVVLIPFLQKADVPSVYGIADLFVLPSLSEPWGLVVNEAMACGVPVIVSQRAGCVGDLVVQSETGWVIDPTDSISLASAMSQLIQDPDYRQRLASRALEAVAYFSSDQSAARMASFLRSVHS